MSSDIFVEKLPKVQASLYLDIVRSLQKVEMVDIAVEPMEKAYVRVL